MALSIPSTTAAYMGRCVLLTFYGEYRGHAKPRESPSSMTGPLVERNCAPISCATMRASEVLPRPGGP